MTIEHPDPSSATAKYLYGNAYRCAHNAEKKCGRPLYRVDEQTGERILNSRICHIHARREGGPRWDPAQSAEDNRSEGNLILMCLEHASAIDNPALVAAYPPDRLRDWKAKQLAEFDQLAQGWKLTDSMADEVIKASAGPSVSIINSTIKLGGQGGQAPGAGGGGGGAVGPGARGGDGGGGGQHLTATFAAADLKAAGVDLFEIKVGKGGVAASLPGEHAKSGEDSVVRLLAKDGTFIKEIRARGGAAGNPGAADAADRVAELSAEDIRSGFQITTLMPANAIDRQNGLIFILGGGWVTWPLPQIPAPATWPILCTARWTKIEGNTARKLYLSLFHPDGHEVSCVKLNLAAESIPLNNTTWVFLIGAELDALGPWKLQVHSGGFSLAEFAVAVILSPLSA